MKKTDMIFAHINYLLILFLGQIISLIFTVLAIMLIPIFILQVAFLDAIPEIKETNEKESN